MVSLAGAPLPWRESDGNTACALPASLWCNEHPSCKYTSSPRSSSGERAAEKEYKHIGQSQVNIGKVKSQLQLNLPAMQREAKRVSASNASSKRKFKENISSEMNGVDNPLTGNMEKLASGLLHVVYRLGKGQAVDRGEGTVRDSSAKLAVLIKKTGAGWDSSKQARRVG